MLLYTAADCCLFFAHHSNDDASSSINLRHKRSSGSSYDEEPTGGLTNSDRWFALLLRSSLQVLVGAAFALAHKRSPVGPVRKMVPLVFLVRFSYVWYTC